MNLLGNNFIIGLTGETLTLEEERWFKNFGAGGVVFFARNLKSKDQIQNLFYQIREAAKNSPNPEPLFCIDMEGGRVAELKSGFQSWPSPLEWLEQNPGLSLVEYGAQVGGYLRQLGFHVNFAPCLDVFTNPANDLMRGRTLGETPSLVERLGVDLIEGYQEAGILTCAKHYPGHGHTSLDSHFDLPADHRSESELITSSLGPFQMASQKEVTFFMTAHVMYPNIDAHWPATLSEVFLRDWLIKKIKYQGFCLADDLDMGALRSFGTPVAVAERFVKSGGDILMYCHRKSPPFEIIEHLSGHLNEDDTLRLQKKSQDLARLKLAFV